MAIVESPSGLLRPLDLLRTYFESAPDALNALQEKEFHSLLQEKDSELLSLGLSSLASRLERADQIGAAAEIYSTILEILPGKSDSDLTQKLQRRIEGIQGQGSLGARAEFLLKRFAKDVFDPKAIVPMMIGTSVFSLTRTLALGYLGSSALFRTIGSRFAASSLGFVAEVPAFAMSARALRPASSPEPSVGQELAGAAITLGLLKAFGHGAQALRATPLLRNVSSFQQQLLSQAAMFGGLMTAHQVEERIGLRSHVDGATTVLDTVASMFSLGIGASLAGRLLGPRFADFQEKLNRKHATYSNEGKWEPDLLSLRPMKAAFAGNFLSKMSRLPRPEALGILLSKGGKSGSEFEAKAPIPPANEPAISEASKLIEDLAKGPNPSAETLVRISKTFDKLEEGSPEEKQFNEALGTLLPKLPRAEIEKLIELAQSDSTWLTALHLLKMVKRDIDPVIRERVDLLLFRGPEDLISSVEKKLELNGSSWVLPEIRKAIQKGELERAILFANTTFSNILESGEDLSPDSVGLLHDLFNLPHARIRSELHGLLVDQMTMHEILRFGDDEKLQEYDPIMVLTGLTQQAAEREKSLLAEDFLSNDPSRVYFAKMISRQLAELAGWLGAQDPRE